MTDFHTNYLKRKKALAQAIRQGAGHAELHALREDAYASYLASTVGPMTGRPGTAPTMTSRSPRRTRPPIRSASARV